MKKEEIFRDEMLTRMAGAYCELLTAFPCLVPQAVPARQTAIWMFRGSLRKFL